MRKVARARPRRRVALRSAGFVTGGEVFHGRSSPVNGTEHGKRAWKRGGVTGASGVVARAPRVTGTPRRRRSGGAASAADMTDRRGEFGAGGRPKFTQRRQQRIGVFAVVRETACLGGRRVDMPGRSPRRSCAAVRSGRRIPAVVPGGEAPPDGPWFPGGVPRSRSDREPGQLPLPVADHRRGRLDVLHVAGRVFNAAREAKVLTLRHRLDGRPAWYEWFEAARRSRQGTKISSRFDLG